jgi:hypothetical protein
MACSCSFVEPRPKMMVLLMIMGHECKWRGNLGEVEEERKGC